MHLKKDKSGDIVGRPSWRSSLPSDPGATFFCRKLQQMKNSLNFANTCLKVVDTRRGTELRLKHRSPAQRNVFTCAGGNLRTPSLSTTVTKISSKRHFDSGVPST